MRIFLLSTFFAFVLSVAVEAGPEPEAASPAELVAAALEGAERAADAEAAVELLTDAIEGLRKLPAEALGVMHREQLERALAASAEDAAQRAEGLTRALRSMRTDLAFEPTMESAMPPGFPAPGPVGKVVVKKYPKYRAARAEGGAASFWTLFNHIKKNDVQMTAPVEMTMDEGMRAKDMAFLYERLDQGKTGRQGEVAVVDLEPRTVLSVGLRGMRTKEALARAKGWLEAHAEANGWVAAGSIRAMGYNSPMVPQDRQFWELQLPVKKPEAAAKTDGQ